MSNKKSNVRRALRAFERELDFPAEVGPEPSDTEIIRMTKHAYGGNSWAKLRDGSWGVYVSGSAKPGDSVVVKKKNGTSSTVILGRQVWKGSGTTLFTVNKDGGGSRSRRNRGPAGTYECDECGDYVKPGTRCWETGMTH